MISNVGEMPIVDRDVGGPRTGFEAVLPRHEAGHDATYFRTTTQTFFGETKAKQTPGDVIMEFTKTQQMRAGDDKWVKTESLRKISGLVGEVYNTQHDPQVKSEVQRAWIQKKD